MKHLFWICCFSALTGVVFGAVAKGTKRHRLIYGLKVFAEFVLAALVLGWLLYFLPFP